MTCKSYLKATQILWHVTSLQKYPLHIPRVWTQPQPSIGKILATRNRSPDPPFIGRNSRVNTATNTTPSHTHNPRQVVRAREISLRQKCAATISLAHIAHHGPHRPRTYRPRFVRVRKQARRVSAKTGGLHSNLGLLQSETDATWRRRLAPSGHEPNLPQSHFLAVWQGDWLNGWRKLDGGFQFD